MRKFREPALVGSIIFLSYLIANSLGHAWEEALTAGLGAALIVWVFRAGKTEPDKKAQTIKRKLGKG